MFSSRLGSHGLEGGPGIKQRQTQGMCQMIESQGAGFTLRENLFDYGTMEFGEAFFTAKMEIRELVLVEAELIQNGRMEISEVNPISHGVDTQIIRSADYGAALDAASSHPPGKASRAMIPPQRIGVAAFRQGRSAKLSSPHNQRCV